MDRTIDIGTSTIYLTGETVYSIDWDSDDTKDKIAQAYQKKKVTKNNLNSFIFPEPMHLVDQEQ